MFSGENENIRNFCQNIHQCIIVRQSLAHCSTSTAWRLQPSNFISFYLPSDKHLPTLPHQQHFTLSTQYHVSPDLEWVTPSFICTLSHLPNKYFQDSSHDVLLISLLRNKEEIDKVVDIQAEEKEMESKECNEHSFRDGMCWYILLLLPFDISIRKFHQVVHLEVEVKCLNYEINTNFNTFQFTWLLLSQTNTVRIWIESKQKLGQLTVAAAYPWVDWSTLVVFLEFLTAALSCELLGLDNGVMIWGQDVSHDTGDTMTSCPTLPHQRHTGCSHTGTPIHWSFMLWTLVIFLDITLSE